MIWGATIQALEAIGHLRAGNSTGLLSSNGRRRLAASVISDGLRSYGAIQDGLHAHFYPGPPVPAGVRRQDEARARLRQRAAGDCLVVRFGRNMSFRGLTLRIGEIMEGDAYTLRVVKS